VSIELLKSLASLFHSKNNTRTSTICSSLLLRWLFENPFLDNTLIHSVSFYLRLLSNGPMDSKILRILFMVVTHRPVKVQLNWQSSNFISKIHVRVLLPASNYDPPPRHIGSIGSLYHSEFIRQRFIKYHRNRFETTTEKFHFIKILYYVTGKSWNSNKLWNFLNMSIIKNGFPRIASLAFV